ANTPTTDIIHNLLFVWPDRAISPEKRGQTIHSINCSGRLIRECNSLAANVRQTSVCRCLTGVWSSSQSVREIALQKEKGDAVTSPFAWFRFYLLSAYR